MGKGVPGQYRAGIEHNDHGGVFNSGGIRWYVTTYPHSAHPMYPKEANKRQIRSQGDPHE